MCFYICINKYWFLLLNENLYYYYMWNIGLEELFVGFRLLIYYKGFKYILIVLLLWKYFIYIYNILFIFIDIR